MEFIMPNNNSLPAAREPLQTPNPELFELSNEELRAEKLACEKSNRCAFWLKFVSIPGMFISGVIAFYELASIANDKITSYQPEEAIKKDLKVFIPSASTGVGFFGAYQYARCRMNKNQVKLERIEEELQRREITAAALSF
jgi:hypothetical protein